VGLLVGWFIKNFRFILSICGTLADISVKEKRSVRLLLFLLSRREITNALTSLALGFLALLLLSRHELPTGAIHDSLALGIGLGFLSDDQLLTRIKIPGASIKSIAGALDGPE
jgi:hypothetical protein